MIGEKIMLLVRHAKSSHDLSYLEDKLRPLADRGKSDCNLIGKRMQALHLIPDKVYCSTAVRTRATLAILNRYLSVPESLITYHDDLYTFHDSGSTYVDYLHNTLDDIDTVMLTSHNGSCLNVADEVSHGEISAFPTCAVLICRWQLESWSDVRLDNVSTYQLLTPKQLK